MAAIAVAGAAGLASGRLKFLDPAFVGSAYLFLKKKKDIRLRWALWSWGVELVDRWKCCASDFAGVRFKFLDPAFVGSACGCCQ